MGNPNMSGPATSKRIRKMGFVRNTHTVANEVRDFGNINRLGSEGLYHLLGPDPISFDRFLKKIESYNAQWPEAPFPSNPAQVAGALIWMIENDVVAVSEMDT